MSIASLSCLKTLPIHHCFLCQIEFSICLSSFTLLRNSSLVTIKLANLFHSSYPHFKCWSSSVGVSVHVFAAYSIFATLQTKHFVIFYFNSRLDLSVNNFLFSINTFFICFKYSLCSIHHLILSYLNVGIALPLVVHQYKLSFFFILAYAQHLHHFHIYLHTPNSLVTLFEFLVILPAVLLQSWCNVVCMNV